MNENNLLNEEQKEYGFDSYMNENNLFNVEQDEMEKIWEKVRQNYNTWSEMRSQGNDWCMDSIQVYKDWPAADGCQVVWKDCSNYW